MSRLTDLIGQVERINEDLAAGLWDEFKHLSKRRAFGLNFEEHQPEFVHLPGTAIRQGTKVRILPPRGSKSRQDQGLWQVENIDGDKVSLIPVLGEKDTTREEALENLIAVSEFNAPVHPGLVSTGKVERGGDKPFHTVMNGENYHALHALSYTHRGKIDAIYIDPPYNSGARDWKYNNDYVDKEDSYRHSKWLAMMERRLKLAKKLLNPDKSVLIVTIDEKEYLRLGLLLEQTFVGATIQMVTTIIAPQGQQRPGRFSRMEEYLFCVMFGSSKVLHSDKSMIDTVQRKIASNSSSPVWDSLIRRGTDATRADSPTLFYPVYVSDGQFVDAGKPPPLNTKRLLVKVPDKMTAVWPIRTDGSEGRWQVSPQRLRELFKEGYARVGKISNKKRPAITYLKAGEIKKLEEGVAHKIFARAVWNQPSHNAGSYGSTLLRKFLPRRKFPFPKSLYAVEDALRFFVADNPDAIIMDFFAGSGTTAHAVMRLNKQDGGRRQSISITNNEVSAREETRLKKDGLRPGDPDWDKWGICDYITIPRITAAITGRTPEGTPIKGEYKFTDEFSMAEGFAENAAFFNLSYESPIVVEHNMAFEKIAPLLWMRAGSAGRLIESLPDKGWDVAEAYGVLEDPDAAKQFSEAVKEAEQVKIVFILEDDDACFQAVCKLLPQHVQAVRLYESYLSDFELPPEG